jgi:hypothetical protein
VKWTWQFGNVANGHVDLTIGQYEHGDVGLVIWECRLGTLDMKLGNVDLITL